MLGDGISAPRLLQAFDRDEALPEARAEMLFPLAPESMGADIESLPDQTQVCNCNGVTKGQVIEAVEGGHRSLKAVCDATRAGTGCGSCKPQVQAILEFAAGGLIAEDPSANYYVPGIAMSKPELVEAVKSLDLKSVSSVFETLADGREDAGSKVGLASLLRTVWGSEYEDERDARFINDRVHANIQRNGTFSVVPRMYGGITTPDELRPHSRRRREVQRRDGQDNRRPAHRHSGHPQRTLAGRLARAGYAVGPRLHQGVSVPARHVWERTSAGTGLGTARRSEST